MAGEFLLCAEVGKVIVVGPYFKGVRMTLEVMAESFEGANDSEEFFVTNLFVTGTHDRENARDHENTCDQVAPTSHVTVGTHMTYHVTSGPLGYHVTYHVTYHVIQLAQARHVIYHL